MIDQNRPRHPLNMNGKPMHDFYYTRDGLCRPVPCGTAPAETYKDYCEFLLTEIGTLQEMVIYLAQEIGGRDGIVGDIIDGAKEATKRN